MPTVQSLTKAAALQNTLEGGLVQMLFEGSQFVNRFFAIPTNSEDTYKFKTRSALVPSVMRLRGQTITPSQGDLVTVTERTGILTTFAELDNADYGNPVMQADAIEDAVTSMALTLPERIIKADSANDEADFDGLYARVTSDNHYELEISASTANGGYLDVDVNFEKLLAATRRCAGPASECVILGDVETHALVDAAIAARNAYRHAVTVQDGRREYNELIDFFNSVEWVHIENDATDTPIMGFNETKGSDDFTGSILIVWLGKARKRGVNLLYNSQQEGVSASLPGAMGNAVIPPNIIKLDRMWNKNNTQWQRQVEANFGLADHHARSIIRVSGIKNTLSP